MNLWTSFTWWTLQAAAFACGVGIAMPAWAALQNNSYPASGPTLSCSGRPYIDIMCYPGTDPTGGADSTTAINSAVSDAIGNGGVPIHFPQGTFRVTSKITLDYAGIAAAGLEIISDGATIDGRTIAAGNVLQFQCSGGTTASPVTCSNLRIQGTLTVLGNTPAYVAVIGKTDLSDIHAGVRLDHLIATNASTSAAAGGVQANYVSGRDLWLSGTTAGGSPNVAAIALEQVQNSRIAGFASAAGPSAVGLLMENGTSSGNMVSGFSFAAATNTCVSILSTAAKNNGFFSLTLPCTTAINAPQSSPASGNLLYGPNFAGTNSGPISSGIGVVGRGSLNRFQTPAVASYTLNGADDGTIFSSANAGGPATQFALSSLPLTLPLPSQVGNNWSAGFVSDANKAVVLTVPAGAHIISNGKLLSSLTVGAGGSNGGSYETAVLQSDGANFRVAYITQAAALLNGLQFGWPANWTFLPGPGYQATIEDNAEVISSALTTSGLSVTLPQTTTIPNGWSISFSQDGGKQISVTVNGTNGGQILRQGVGAGQSSFSTLLDHQVITLSYDGASFREMSSSSSKRIDVTAFGAKCGSAVDSTPAFQAADNYLSGAGGGGTITVSCPLTVAGGFTLDDYVSLEGEGPVYYRGMLWLTPSGGSAVNQFPPAAGPAINCLNLTIPCITVNGGGVAIQNLNVGNPIVPPSPTAAIGSWAPPIYPYIIATSAPKNWSGLFIEKVTCTSTSKCIDLEGTPDYSTAGVAGTQWTVRDIYCNPCLNQGILEHRLDNTGEINNIQYDFDWNRANPVVGAYVKTHSVGMTWQYAANTRFHGLEFFSNRIAIDQINDTVNYGGGFFKTLAAFNMQGVNISFNEVCQAMANESGLNLISTGVFTNVLLYQDSSDPQVNCPLNSPIAIDLSASFGANWVMNGLRAATVQTIADIGPNSTLDLDHVDVSGYSYYAPGAPAFKVSAGADFSLGESLKGAIRTAVGTCAYGPCGTAGALLGPGLDGTQGYERPFCVGGGAIPKEGSACLVGGGAGNNGQPSTGYLDLYLAPIGTLVTGGAWPSNRGGYFGFCTATGCTLATAGSLFLTPEANASPAPPYFEFDAGTSPVNGTIGIQTGAIVLQPNRAAGGANMQINNAGPTLLINVSGLPPVCTGLPAGTLYTPAAHQVGVC